MSLKSNRPQLRSTRSRGGEFTRHPRLAVSLLAAATLCAVAGCGKPNAANIDLRRQLQAKDDELSQVRVEREADRAALRSLQSSTATTVPSLPIERLDALFTTHGFRLGRLTGFAYTDVKNPGADGIKVYLTPFDAGNDDLKAAGTITVEAFDLSAGGKQVGKWDFPTAESRKLWNGQGLLYEYVVPCLFEPGTPHGSELTLKVTFVDELTGRSFTQQQVIKHR